MAPNLERAEKRIKELEEQLRQAKALKQKVEARARAEAAKKKRAEDTRRKVLLGAFLLQQMESDPATHASVLRGLQGFLTRPDDRELFGLAVASTAVASAAAA